MEYFNQLPAEVLLNIFGYLNCSDLCRLRRTCKRFQKIITIWENVFLKHISPVVTNQSHNEFLAK